VLLATPLLMVMVLMGGSGDLADVCAPGSDSVVLAAGTADGQLDSEQLANASAIVSEGSRMAVPRRAIVIALAVAHQESGLRVYANDGLGDDLAPDQAGIERSLSLAHEAVGTDHGSLGVFQQQWPWWGTMPELMDPATSARKFYLRLLQGPGWEQMSLTAAGQAVQRSAYPDAYADDEPLAEAIVAGAPLDAVQGQAQTAAYLGGTAGGGCSTQPAFTGDVVFPLAASSGYVDQQNWGHSGSHWDSTHTGTDLSVACGTPVHAATDGIVTVRTDQPWAGRWLVEIEAGPGRVLTWYAHMQAVSVASGDRVVAGQRIGEVGQLGNATGCHLHFEVHPNGADATVDPTRWLHDNAGRAQLSTVARTSSGGQAVPREAVTMITANVQYVMSARQARRHITHLLGQHPDVLVLQEVGARNIARIAAGVSPDWSVWQGPGRKAETAIVWDSTRFRAVRHGIEFGVRVRNYQLWMPWVLLESDGGTLPVVGLHLPTNSSKDLRRAVQYRIMTRHYLRLVAAMNHAGYPPVLGGDWNHSLDRPREPWGPVTQLPRVGLTTNWQHGYPCAGSSALGGHIDGFAYNPRYLRMVDQGCLRRGPSDHRPVWIALAPAG
jgi:murein DD-endopeptidase MepM/ murein hydrolase activator NlpD